MHVPHEREVTSVRHDISGSSEPLISKELAGRAPRTAVLRSDVRQLRLQVVLVEFAKKNVERRYKDEGHCLKVLRAHVKHIAVSVTVAGWNAPERI